MNTIHSNIILVHPDGQPSVDDVLATIDRWDDLTPAKRDVYLRAVGKAMHIQSVVAPRQHGPVRFTCEALNATLWLKAPSTFGMRSNQSFSNLVSACRSVLIRMGLCDAKVPLTRAWQALHDALPTHERQIGLIGFMTFCAATDIAPEAVSSELLDRFELWCSTRQLRRDPVPLTRRTASGWNWAAEHVPGWPQVKLSRRNMRLEYTTPLSQFPQSFQDDVRRFLDRLAAGPMLTINRDGLFAPKGGIKGPRGHVRAARPRTLQTHQNNIRAGAAALLLTGTPIDRICSLEDLVAPLEVAARIVQFHYARRCAREAAETYKTRPALLIGIVETLRQIAKFHCRLPDEQVAQFTQWKASLTPAVQGTMNEKNNIRLRSLLQTDKYVQMLHLPDQWSRRAVAMWEAAKEKADQPDEPPPLEAARLMMFAVAIEILLFCPLRRSNLVTLHLHRDFTRCERTGRISRLLVLAGKTKTSETIDWPVPEPSVKLIQRYIDQYRPLLTNSGNEFLFPGLDHGARNEAEFGTQVARRVEQEIGVEFNMHLARHFGVVRYLRHNPGQYTIVSRLLGHKTVETTIRFYAGLEVDAAATQANKLFVEEKAQTRQAAAAAFGGARRGRPRGAASAAKVSRLGIRAL